jgi:hypothetical protein
MRRAALVLLALALTGCETSAEKSAELEKLAKLQENHASQHQTLLQRGLSITRQSTKVRVISTSMLHSSEGAAAVVLLRNLSNTPLHDVPVEITVRDAHGATVYSNNTPGLAAALVYAPLVPAHGTSTWVDDQIQISGISVSLSAKVGEGRPFAGATPQLSVQGAHVSEDPTSGAGAEGEIVNRSTVTQRELVVDALARRGGKIVAAGRAVLPQAPGGTSTHFQLYFIGDPRGAQLEMSVPPTTLG